MLTGYLWIKFHWGKNTLVSLYLACDDDICNWLRNQSKDISLMPPPPKFGKRETIANFWLAKNGKITEFALVRPGSKNPIISRITYKKVKETIFRNYFLNWRSHLFYATCWQIFHLNKQKKLEIKTLSFSDIFQVYQAQTRAAEYHINYLTYEGNIYHKQRSKLLSLYSVRLTPGGWPLIVRSRRSHHVHNFPSALPGIPCSQIFYRFDCLYFLYDILVFLSSFHWNLLSY